MQIKSNNITERSGRVVYRKLAANSGPANNNGKRAVINIIKTIIMLDTIIRYLNFNENAPIIS